MPVYKLLIIAAVISLSACSRKTFPVTTTRDVKDSTLVETIVTYRSDTIMLKGDTVTLTATIPCPDVVLKEQKNSGRVTLNTELKNGVLKVECVTDSLMHVVDSLKELNTRIMRIKSEVITVSTPVDVIKYRIPFWVVLLIVVNLLYITGRITGKIKV